MIRWLGPLTATVALTACGTGQWHWTTPGVHAVDGFWVVNERSCEPAAMLDGREMPDRLCNSAREAGLETL